MMIIILLIFDLGNCENWRSSPSGAIQSPNYPSAYPHEQKCTWFVSIEDSVVDIKVSFRYEQLLLVLSSLIVIWAASDLHVQHFNRSEGEIKELLVNIVEKIY